MSKMLSLVPSTNVYFMVNNWEHVTCLQKGANYLVTTTMMMRQKYRGGEACSNYLDKGLSSPFIYASILTAVDRVRMWGEKEPDVGLEGINNLSFLHAVVHENWVLSQNNPDPNHWLCPGPPMPTLLWVGWGALSEQWFSKSSRSHYFIH